MSVNQNNVVKLGWYKSSNCKMYVYLYIYCAWELCYNFKTKKPKLNSKIFIHNTLFDSITLLNIIHYVLCNIVKYI